jgi:hypothetical protein
VAFYWLFLLCLNALDIFFGSVLISVSRIGFSKRILLSLHSILWQLNCKLVKHLAIYFIPNLCQVLKPDQVPPQYFSFLKLKRLIIYLIIKRLWVYPLSISPRNSPHQHLKRSVFMLFFPHRTKNTTDNEVK